MPDEADSLRRETSLEHYARPEKRLAKCGLGTVYKYIDGVTGNVYAAKVLYYDFEDLDSEGNPDNMVHILREQYVAPRLVHVSHQSRSTIHKDNLRPRPT